MLLKNSLVVLALLMLSSPAWSAKEEPRSPWVMYWDLTGRHNPSDFFATFGLDRRHVYNRSVSSLWDGAYVQAGAEASFNPGHSRGSLIGEWAPLKPFKLKASFDLLLMSIRAT